MENWRRVSPALHLTSYWFLTSLGPSPSCQLPTPTMQWQEAGQRGLSSQELVSPNFPLQRARLFVHWSLLALSPLLPGVPAHFPRSSSCGKGWGNGCGQMESWHV